MTDFERALVNSFNSFFQNEEIEGIAHRKKQHRFSSQLCDVLVDSPHESFYLAIENKSVKTDSTNKLYFSTPFSESEKGHQVDRISDFIDRSGRKGYLAVEFRRGRGRSRKAYMVPWEDLRDTYESGEPGMSLERITEYPELFREKEDYDLEENMIEMFT